MLTPEITSGYDFRTGSHVPICRSVRVTACLLLASLAPCCADPAPAIHYAPIENLEHVDVALIDRRCSGGGVASVRESPLEAMHTFA
jgi:hypothetical protein